MGDLPPDSQLHPMDFTAAGLARDNQHVPLPSSPPHQGQDGNTPFYSQLSSIPQGQHRPDHRSSAQNTAHYASQHEPSAFKMGAMTGALPDYTSDAQNQASHSVPRSISGASTSALVYQLGQSLQMPAHVTGNMPMHPSYSSGYGASPYHQGYMPQQSAHGGIYPTYNPTQPRMQGVSPMQNAYQPYQQPSQYMYFPAPFGAQGQYSGGYPTQGTQGQPIFGRRPSLVTATLGMPGQNMEPSPHEGNFAAARMMPGDVSASAAAAYNAPYYQGPGMPRSTSVSSIPRGPPRKPKQSGHALWVGNLPPGTTVVSMKDHFSRDATKDIESLFLISKSNCAFVNYRTEAACTAAMHRFHDSRFNGVRLVCRLRRSSAPASGVPTGPSAMTSTQQTTASPPMSPSQEHEPETGLPDGASESEAHHTSEETVTKPIAANKYFIVKSLTLQDLELSIRNGIWATQSHNEDVLNKAYESAENVYLIFSANKSGEYFGYARMTSPILEDGSDLISSAPKPENIMDAPDVPKSIPTPATEWAPRGRIIDDSARGTIFWEAELSDSDGEEEATDKVETQVDGDPPVVAQSWGKPFRVEWLSANRLPFYRTRGLRNPWNANREVKIARDGTELEPGVGERLIQMFHRLGPPMPPVQLGGPVIPQMRPF